MDDLPLSNLYSQNPWSHWQQCSAWLSLSHWWSSIHSLKENSPMLATKLTGHTLKQRIQPLTIFTQKASFVPQWMPSYSTADQKALTIWTVVEKKSSKKTQEAHTVHKESAFDILKTHLNVWKSSSTVVGVLLHETKWHVSLPCSSPFISHTSTQNQQNKLHWIFGSPNPGWGSYQAHCLWARCISLE